MKARNASSLAALADLGRGGRGVLGSFFTYYGSPRRQRSLDRLYRRFVKPGDLVFDIGSHVGDRVASFRRLGARVLAIEPQAWPARILRLLHGRDPQVSIERVAVGARAGTADLLVNLANPTVSTLSPSFVAAAQGASGWEGQVWDARVRIPLTTLDSLIEKHGTPAFAKIDIEGYEAEALAGLSSPLGSLSFEFTTIQRTVARECLAACQRLGNYQFNASIGETHRLVHDQWLSAPEIDDWLKALPHATNSGDIYAILLDDMNGIRRRAR
jgi:FkbM family methyltransferase